MDWSVFVNTKREAELASEVANEMLDTDVYTWDDFYRAQVVNVLNNERPLRERNDAIDAICEEILVDRAGRAIDRAAARVRQADLRRVVTRAERPYTHADVAAATGVPIYVVEQYDLFDMSFAGACQYISLQSRNHIP
jgi:hypothetical protein